MRTYNTFKQEEHDAFAPVQDKLVSALEPTVLHSKGHLTLGTDACDEKIGYVLMQEQPEGAKMSFRY